MPLAIAVAIFCRNAVVPSSFSSFGLVINEVSTSTDGIDGDFSTTNAACSVLRLCSLCTGLIFFRICEPSVRLFLMVSVCTRSNSNILLLILLFLMPLAQYIPMACLAGVLVIVSYNMSGWRTFKALLKNPKSDVTVLLITFFLTVIFDLTVAIEVGLLIACVLFMKRVMETTEISVIKNEIDPNNESDLEVHEEHLMVPKGVEVYEINGPYFFGIATKFEEIMSELGDRPKVRIVRMRKVPFIDSTGIHNLTNLCEMSKKENIQIVLSGVNEKVHQILEKSGFNELLGKENICPNINVALEKAKAIIEK